MDTPTLMGIVNATPDSFSDGGRYLDRDAAVEHGLELVPRGRRCSTWAASPRGRARSRWGRRRSWTASSRWWSGSRRPASACRWTPPSSPWPAPRSAAGATIVNDVSAFRADPGMAALVAEAGTGCCLVHMRGEPRTMHHDPSYGDVVSEVKAFLEERLAFAVARGRGRGSHLARSRHRLRQERGAQPGAASPARRDRGHRPAGGGWHLAQELSGKLAGGREADDRLPGTIATNVMALERGASVFRVHDVRAVADALKVAAATVGP